MSLLDFSILVAFCLSAVLATGQCPPGGIDYGDAGECIVPINAKTNYTAARQICSMLNGQIIQIGSYFENVLASSQAQSVIAMNSLSFIGIVKGPNGTWTYDDGRALTYQNWKAGHPQTDMNCAVLSAQNFQWTSVTCDSQHTFVCAVPDQACPTGWTRNPQNGMCYYFKTVANLSNPDRYNFTAAEYLCQSAQGHLASIHSVDENNYIKNQIATNWPSADCSFLQAVIGLQCTSNVYTWTDGTIYDYDGTNGQCSQSYGIANEAHCAVGKTYWDYWSLNQPYWRYICKKAPMINVIGPERLQEILKGLDKTV